jgi:hypothetical protein
MVVDGNWKGKDSAQNVGKKFVTDFASALWYVDTYLFVRSSSRQQQNHSR